MPVSVAEAQQWLERTKIVVSEIESELDSSATNYVYGRLAATYDVAAWTVPPSLVRTVISMLYASWFYNRQYSEDNGENEWAVRLENKAEAILSDIVAGNITLTDSTAVDTGQPSFLPNDDAPVFVMGERW